MEKTTEERIEERVEREIEEAKEIYGEFLEGETIESYKKRRTRSITKPKILPEEKQIWDYQQTKINAMSKKIQLLEKDSSSSLVKQLNTIELGPNEKLAVEVPGDVHQAQLEKIHDLIASLFPAERCFSYREGELSLTKIKVEE